MKKSRYSDSQIMAILRQTKAGDLKIPQALRRYVEDTFISTNAGAGVKACAG